MRICFIDWFAYGLFNPKSKIVFGGAQIQLYLLARELSKDNNNEIYFLTDSHKISQVEKLGKIKVHQLLRSRWLFGYGQFFIRLFLQLRKIDADYFVQRAASAETGLIALTCKLLNKKFIFMVAHEQDVNGDFVKRSGWQGKLYYLGLKLADKIICQTKDQQAFLFRRFKNKSVVILSGYPRKSLKKISSKKRGVLWVARAEEWKQPELFIKLAKKFPREKFTMICPPAENNPRYFQMIKAKANAVFNIKFIKQVPFSKIDSYFAMAKVFVSTSISEGFPNTFIQAWQNLTPVISYKVNPDKIIDKYRIGFQADGDERQIEKLLKRILKNNQLRRQLAVNAYNYVRRNHDLKQTAANIIASIF